MIAPDSGMIPLRGEIDAIDAAIIKLLRQRLDVVERVVTVKRREGLPAAIPSRVEEVVAHVRARAEEARLPADLAEALWRKLIDWTIHHEETRIPGDR